MLNKHSEKANIPHHPFFHIDDQNDMITFDSDFELEHAVMSCNNPPLLVTAVRQGYGSSDNSQQANAAQYPAYGAYPPSPYGGYPPPGYGGYQAAPYGAYPYPPYGMPPGYGAYPPQPPQQQQHDAESARIRILEAQVVALLDQKEKRPPTAGELAASSGLPSRAVSSGAKLGQATANATSAVLNTAVGGAVSVAASAGSVVESSGILAETKGPSGMSAPSARYVFVRLNHNLLKLYWLSRTCHSSLFKLSLFVVAEFNSPYSLSLYTIPVFYIESPLDKKKNDMCFIIAGVTLISTPTSPSGSPFSLLFSILK
jgi:hypothetical protein